MPANEIVNRHAAGFWLQATGAAGEGVATWNGGIEILSGMSIRDHYITAAQPDLNPLIIVPLDRVFNRRRMLVNWAVPTITDAANRFSQPYFTASLGDPDWTTWEGQKVGVQPMMLEWMGPGPDYSSPDWLPFNLPYGASISLDPAFDADLFDAIAILLPLTWDTEVPPAPNAVVATNVVVNIFEIPPLEVAQFAVNATLPGFTP